MVQFGRANVGQFSRAPKSVPRENHTATFMPRQHLRERTEIAVRIGGDDDMRSRPEDQAVIAADASRRITEALVDK